MREQRQHEIRSLLRRRPVAAQRELLDALAAKGVSVNQSTLSRDLAELGVRKAHGRYVLPEETGRADGRIDYRSAVLGFLPCGPHMIVIRTAVGQAQPVALAIDAKTEPAIAGTLAGDDTIFIATKNRNTQTVALRRLETWFGEKREH